MPRPGSRTFAAIALAALLAVVFAGCSSTPKASDRDGPLPDPPTDLERVPDAEPRVEPIRNGGANKPYEIEGRRYEPATRDARFSERGLASWYGRKFHGRTTANGERYDMYAMTAAHPTMPLPSYARVRNIANDREVIVRVNDRGPFVKGRVIDLSYTAALKLGLLRGVGIVEVERITNEDIASGAWRRGAAPIAPATAVARVEPPARTEAPTPLAAPPVPGSAAPIEPGFWVQLGAFRQRDGALDFQRKVAAELDWIAPLLAIVDETSLYRLQAGPYASRDEASGAAERLRDALKLVPVIVERGAPPLQ
jgi:rare lipoprotein A